MKDPPFVSQTFQTTLLLAKRKKYISKYKACRYNYSLLWCNKYELGKPDCVLQIMLFILGCQVMVSHGIAIWCTIFYHFLLKMSTLCQSYDWGDWIQFLPKLEHRKPKIEMYNYSTFLFYVDTQKTSPDKHNCHFSFFANSYPFCSVLWHHLW